MSGGLSEQQVHLYTGLFAKHVPNFYIQILIGVWICRSKYIFIYALVRGELHARSAHTLPPDLYFEHERKLGHCGPNRILIASGADVRPDRNSDSLFGVVRGLGLGAV